MKNIGTKLAAVAFMLCATAVPALAGKGGSNAKIVSAIHSGSVDAIVAEVERAESLICDACIETMIGLTADDRLAVREVAAWWFAKRPGAKKIMVTQMKTDLADGSAIEVRNAADFVGYVREYTALPQLRTAFARTGLTSEARLAIVRAVGYMAHKDGNGILTAALADGDASVRVAAITAWRDVLGQQNATPIVGMLGDQDAKVRAEAATVCGAFADAGARLALEGLVVADPNSQVRRNAAWALGKIGSRESTLALTTATRDKSGLVSGVAKAALATLK